MQSFFFNSSFEEDLAATSLHPLCNIHTVTIYIASDRMLGYKRIRCVVCVFTVTGNEKSAFYKGKSLLSNERELYVSKEIGPELRVCSSRFTMFDARPFVVFCRTTVIILSVRLLCLKVSEGTCRGLLVSV